MTEILNECVEWPGKRMPSGYGRIWDGKRRRQKLAHRLAWEEANGQPVPAGLLVLHKCDNPPCVNPAHLRVGTHRDNSQDMVAKGRGIFQKCPELTRKKRVRKLTDEQVRDIRADWRPLKDVAADYGVSISAISTIRRGLRKQLVTP